MENFETIPLENLEIAKKAVANAHGQEISTFKRFSKFAIQTAYICSQLHPIIIGNYQCWPTISNGFNPIQRMK